MDMNDVTTREAVAWVLERMGFKQLARHARNEETNIDTYISYIKHKDKKSKELREFIEYYL